MGEAKRRKKLDPDFGKKPVRVKIEKSKLTEKWLVVAYIFSRRSVISPHHLYDDAVAAGQQVFEQFNTLSVDEWRNFLKGDRAVMSKAISLLDYDDEDGVVGVLRNDLSERDENLVLDRSPETIQKFTELIS